ncbi:MAG TPA: GNAT family N-acetyltransferase [Candidatus Baltobacteraceae bacterium]|jgi:GNAT superfamily N-acetyltransferase|nr:GNAT family N-acetyltransferase [Candidatus Baltobacteraceae bacterium]
MSVDKNNSLLLNGVATEAAGDLRVTVNNSDSEPPPDNPAVRIRAYREADRGAICRLCCDTGFLGGPVDPLFRDRDLFADLFTRPYLDHEPERVFVVETHRQVVGYVLGSVREHFDLVLMRSGLWTTSRMLLRLAGGRYNDHPRSRRFIRWLLTAGFWEQPKHPRAGAHLHFQLAKSHRGQGIAQRLWERYEREIRAAGIKQCYGAFYSQPRRRPEMAYARFGFTVFDRRRTTLFEPEIRDPVEVVCVSKSL